MTLGESAVVPVLGGNGMGGAGLGIGGGVLGGLLAGGLGGALVGGLMGNRGGWGGNGYGGGAPAASAVASEIVLTPTLNAIQNQINGISDTLNAHNIDAGLTSINQNISGTSRDLGRDVANLSTAQANGNFVTLTSINGLGRDVAAQANQNALQQLNSFNNLTTTTLQGFNSSVMQIQNATNQIIAQGSANAAAVATGFCNISKELATCCCEVKQMIQSDGNLTRALINDTNMQNLRDQLATANSKVSNNEQNQYLLNTILTHVKPSSTIV